MAVQQTAERLQARADQPLLNGHRVLVADGTGLSTPDTPLNQQVWPQQRSQKPGWGFPQASACAVFCLSTVGLLSYRLGNKKSS
ncbi:MAG: hypothetical protein DRQ60_11360 [Gammaproteobacteria bacterium]|nr:MAG: hypothetical protein DRQ54_07035 [Gammaproteobacteria bacterium]RLA10374.1 MAG: hypothetical protein DRQ60_11360 [Gammaproteobacteria bacterium]RLA13285.1 MAG: hypothetical protein DRQ52_06530 [Gammaproteobacteria bacterium]